MFLELPASEILKRTPLETFGIRISKDVAWESAILINTQINSQYGILRNTMVGFPYPRNSKLVLSLKIYPTVQANQRYNYTSVRLTIYYVVSP